MTTREGAEVLEDEEGGPDFSTPAYNAGDERQVNLRRRQAGRKEKQKGDFLARVLSEKEGRAWLWSLLEFTGPMRSSFAGDPYQTAFNEGQRNVGLKIMSDIMKAAPEQYAVMAEEANPHD